MQLSLILHHAMPIEQGPLIFFSYQHPQPPATTNLLSTAVSSTSETTWKWIICPSVISLV